MRFSTYAKDEAGERDTRVLFGCLVLEMFSENLKCKAEDDDNGEM